MADVRTFAVLDYIVFGACLMVAAGIGLYHACTGGRQRTTKEFLEANKNMPVMPVVFSMVATFLSTIGILGAPSEMYNFGTLLSWSYFAPALAVPICAHMFLPIFYKLEMVSIYEVGNTRQIWSLFFLFYTFELRLRALYFFFFGWSLKISLKSVRNYRTVFTFKIFNVKNGLFKAISASFKI